LHQQLNILAQIKENSTVCQGESDKAERMGEREKVYSIGAPE
jgi:hypothetical protein